MRFPRRGGRGNRLAGEGVKRHTGDIKSGLIRLGISLAACSLAPVSARADGIALSVDGRIWVSGAGGYGNGWGDVGESVSVPAGSTVYIKYYSASRDSHSLRYAAHGEEWGEWRNIGVARADDMGSGAANPIILRVDNIGTTSSTVRWMNGKGTWSGILSPGAYDFGLKREALWTRPPLIVRAVEPRSWWASFWRPDQSGKKSANSPAGLAVPDSGGTAVLLGCALLTAALLGYTLRRRAKRRSQLPGGIEPSQRS